MILARLLSGEKCAQRWPIGGCLNFCAIKSDLNAISIEEMFNLLCGASLRYTSELLVSMLNNDRREIRSNESLRSTLILVVRFGTNYSQIRTWIWWNLQIWYMNFVENCTWSQLPANLIRLSAISKQLCGFLVSSRHQRRYDAPEIRV